MNVANKVLVTGHRGFIGSNLVPMLVGHEMQVMGVDAYLRGSNYWAALDDRRCIEVQGDLRDLNQSWKDQVLEFAPNYVIHLAAESHVDRSLEDSNNFWTTQVNGTVNLFSVLTASYPAPLLVINQITDEVYGEIPEGQPGAKEGDSFRPRPPYACTKAAQYFVGRSMFTTGRLPMVSTFPVNNFGKWQDTEKLIPKFIHKFLTGGKAPLMQSHGNQRDWLAVEDMCQAFLTLIRKGQPGEDYNIGANNHRTNKQIARILLDMTGRSWNDAIELVPDRVTHDSRYAVDFSKMEALGWRAKTTPEEGLRQVVDWYRERIQSRQ